MGLFGKRKVELRETVAHARLVVSGEDRTAAQVWQLFADMFGGKKRPLLFHLDRLIPVSEGQLRNGFKFEDYNHSGPRRRIEVTTWSPENRLLSIRVRLPTDVEERRRSNTWDYEIIVDEDPRDGDNFVVMLQLVEQSNEPMGAKNLLGDDAFRITEAIGHRHVTDQYVRSGFRPSL